jgi:hypothetical protein
MVFQPGNNANPGGKPKERLWRDAIKSAVKEYTNETDLKLALKKLALSLIRAADNGDMTAIKEMGVRIDGQPEASVSVEHSGSVTHEHKPVSETAEWLEGINRGGALGAPSEPVLN